MAVSEQVAEPWVAMGYYCLSTKKATRAVYFAQKVSTFLSYQAATFSAK